MRDILLIRYFANNLDEMEHGIAKLTTATTTTTTNVEARKGRSRSRHRIIDREAVLKINRRHRSCEFTWPPMMANERLTNSNSQRFDKSMITKKKIAEIKQFFDNYEDNLKELWHMTATERNTKSCDNLTSSSNSAENEYFHLKCYKNYGSKIFRGYKNRRPKTPTTTITTTFNHSYWLPSITTSLSTPNLSKIEVLTKTVATLPKPSLNKYFYLPEEKLNSNELNKIRQHFDKSNDKHHYTIGSEFIQVKNQSENEKEITATKCHGGEGDDDGDGMRMKMTITQPECSYKNIFKTNKTSSIPTTAPLMLTKSKNLLKKSRAKVEKEKLLNESSTLIKKNNLPPVKPPRHAPINNIKVKSSNTLSTTTSTTSTTTRTSTNTSHTAELIKKNKLYNNDSNQNEIQQQLGNVISLLELKQDDNKHGTRDYQTDLKQIKYSTISKQHSKLMNDDCELQEHKQQHQQQQHEDYLSTPIGTKNEYFKNQNRQPKQQQQHQQEMERQEENQNNNCEINEISTTNSKINNRNNLNLDLFFDKGLSMLSSLQRSLQQQQQQQENTKSFELQQQQQQNDGQNDEGKDKITITNNKVESNRTKHRKCNSSNDKFKLSNEIISVENNYDDADVVAVAIPVMLNADQYLSDSSSATTISTSSNLEIESLPDSTPMISTKKCPFCHCAVKDNDINKRQIFTDGEYIYGPYNFDLFSNEFYQFDDDDDKRAGSNRNKTTILLSNDNEHHIINSKLLKHHDDADNLLLLSSSSDILIRDTEVGYGNLHGDVNNINIDNDKIDGNITTNDEPDLIILNDDKVCNEHFNYNQNAKKCDQCHCVHKTNNTPTATRTSTVVIDGGDNYVSNKHDSCNVKNNFNKLNEELCVMHPTNKNTTTLSSVCCSDCYVTDTMEKLLNFSQQFNYKWAKSVDITDENNQQKHSTYVHTHSNSNNNNNSTDEIDDEKCTKYVDKSQNIIFNNGNNKQSGNEKEHYDDTQQHKISCEKCVCCCCCCCCCCWNGVDNIDEIVFNNSTLLSPSTECSVNNAEARRTNKNSYLMLNPLNYHHLKAIDSSTNNNQSPFMQQTNYCFYNSNETDAKHQPSSSTTYSSKKIVGCCRHLSAALTNINDCKQNEPNKIVTLSSLLLLSSSSSSLPTDNNEITFNDDNENSCSHFNNNDNNDERIFNINRSRAVKDSPTKALLYSSSSVNATTMKNSKFNGYFGTELPCQSTEYDLYALKECDENNNKRFVLLPLISNENKKRNKRNNNEILANSSSNVCSTVAGDLLHSPPSTTSQGTFFCLFFVPPL